VQEADHPQETEKSEEEGRKAEFLGDRGTTTMMGGGPPAPRRFRAAARRLPVDLVKLAKIAISPVLGNGLAEFEVALTNP
jgi:hypothetical protein